jgi:hypothetical protein
MISLKFGIITYCRVCAAVFLGCWSFKGTGDGATKIIKDIGLDKPGIPTAHKPGPDG